MKFWLVWREDGGVPTKKHLSERLAKVEAERLARNCPGVSFHVLALAGTAAKEDVKWTPAPAGNDYEPCPF